MTKQANHKDHANDREGKPQTTPTTEQANYGDHTNNKTNEP